MAATIVITDTGVGLDKDTQSRMFEPFWSTKSDRVAGSTAPPPGWDWPLPTASPMSSVQPSLSPPNSIRISSPYADDKQGRDGVSSGYSFFP